MKTKNIFILFMIIFISFGSWMFFLAKKNEPSELIENKKEDKSCIYVDGEIDPIDKLIEYFRSEKIPFTYKRGSKKENRKIDASDFSGKYSISDYIKIGNDLKWFCVTHENGKEEGMKFFMIRDVE